MSVVSVINFKGGTGKSTTAQNLGHAVAMTGRDVLIIDGDRQRNTTDTLLGTPDLEPNLVDVMTGRSRLVEAIRQARDHLYVLPSHTDLEKVSTYLKDHRKAYTTVKRELAELGDCYALVLIDQAGAYSSVMESLLLASDSVIVPTELEPYSVQGLFDMFKKLEDELEDPLHVVGIVPYNANYSREMTKQYIRELHEHFGDLVTDAVGTDVNCSYAQSNGQTIFEYEQTSRVKSRAAADFRRLARLFLPEEETING
jgi:chromosome partitioning protein